MQNLLSLIRSHLFIFAFIFITLGGVSKNSVTYDEEYSVFSYKSFIDLVFRFLIHFEFIFVYGVK